MKIQLKRSSNLENYGQGNEAKRPSPDHMLYGELAVNFNTDDPAIFLKDSGDNIVRIAGAGSTSGNIPGGSTGERPGSGNSVGDLYFDTTLNTVLVWNGTQWVQLALNTVIADDTETNSPPDVTKYPAGTFWFNSSNTEAALYVLYDDPTPEQGKKWVQVAGGGMGLDEIETDLSGVFVKLAGNADPQVITGDGGLRTEGLLESEGGVSVTGNTTFASGLGKDSYDNLIIKNNSQPVIFIYPDGSVRNQSPTKQAFYATGGVDNNEANSKDVTSYAHYRGLNSGQICKNFIAYSASGDARGGTITGDGVGFEAALSLRSLGVRHIGFKGGLNNDTPDSYNFFAEENAPNFFKGDTYIGGKTARNTFELWRSTLTEEQLEQFEAGTYAVPVNVSTPGDGSFARQWYYDQQDAETQALLVSGELDYPEHLAAATFTDTFTLGTATGINLQSDGNIRTKTGGLIIEGNAGVSALAKGISTISNRNNDLVVSRGENRQIKIQDDGKIAISNKGTFPTQSTFFNGSIAISDEVEIKSGTSKAMGLAYCGALSSESDYVDNPGSPVQYIPVNCRPDVYVDVTADIRGFQFDANDINSDINNKSLNRVTGLHIQNVNNSSNKFDHYGIRINTQPSGNGEKSFAIHASGGAPSYFTGLVENEGGLKVSGKRITVSSTNGNKSLLINLIDHQFDQGSDGDNAGLVHITGSGTSAIAAKRHLYGFFIGKNFQDSVSDSLDANATAKLYGIGCNLSDQNGQVYNFYAAGSAPNFFKGSTYFTNPGSSSFPYAAADTSNGAVYINCTSGSIASAPGIEFVNSTSDGKYASIFTSAAGNAGSIKIENSSVAFITNPGGGFFVSTDSRLLSSTNEIVNATETIKALNPKQEGFIAHELQAHVSDAVTGTQDETEAIGTLTDYDGTVLETEVTEPSTDELTYTEEVETDGVATMVTRTRTWSATGTRDVYQGVDQTKLIPLLTKALQEALERIEELESNTLQPLYSTVADLPDASAHHGKTAHVHSEGALYFAHGGNWVKLQNA